MKGGSEMGSFVGDPQNVERVKNDPRIMLRCWSTAIQMNDPDGEVLFAGVLKDRHGLDVRDEKALNAFTTNLEKEGKS
jgi:hypothetical protein